MYIVSDLVRSLKFCLLLLRLSCLPLDYARALPYLHIWGLSQNPDTTPPIIICRVSLLDPRFSKPPRSPVRGGHNSNPMDIAILHDNKYIVFFNN